MSWAQNVERIVCGVVRQAVFDAGANGVALLDDASPEAALLGDWFTRAFPELLHRIEGHGAEDIEREADARDRGESIAIDQGLLTAAPVNKSVLLLSAIPVQAVLLPLGDLYASEVRELAGDWRGSPIVRTLEGLCGGIDVLDTALRARFEQRMELPRALAGVPEAAREPVLQALETGRFSRSRVGLVPKLGSRTPGIDLFA